MTGESLHPNRAGAAELARLVAEDLERQQIRPGQAREYLKKIYYSIVRVGENVPAVVLLSFRSRLACGGCPRQADPYGIINSMRNRMIKKIGQSMAAAMAATVLLAGLPAEAATTIDATGFSLSHLGGQNSIGFDMTLLSDTNGTVQIDLYLGHYGYSLDAFLSGDGANGSVAAHQLAGAVKQGYRITSITLSGVALGELVVDEPVTCGLCTLLSPGLAENRSGVGLSVSAGGVTGPLVADERTGIKGLEIAPVAATAAQSLDGTFELDARTWNHVEVAKSVVLYDSPEHFDYFYGNAYAYADTGNFVLTVQVSAVPEPATYAMLLAGLGVAGWAARRRV